MAYVGNPQAAAFSSKPPKQDLTGASGTSLTLSHAVSNAESIDLFINNVRQEPTTAYSVSDTTVTLTGSVVASDDIYVIYNSLALQESVPPDGSVTDAKITAMAASKLTGALPAISGAALTNLPSAILQVKYTQFIGTSSQINLSSNTDTALSDLTVSITPTATSSIILLQTHVFFEGSIDDHNFVWMFYRDSTVLKAPVGGSRRSGISAGSTSVYIQDNSSTPSTAVYQYFDAPSSTSAITYKVGINSVTADSLYINRSYSATDSHNYERGISYISATEIAG